MLWLFREFVPLLVKQQLYRVKNMPDFPPSSKLHARLEWWRRVGFDAAQHGFDDSVKWQPIIVFVMIGVAILIAFIVLCFDVVPGGANVWSSASWGLHHPSGTCETENQNRMIHQMFTAISSFGYAFVAVMVGLLTYLDASIAWQRFRSRKRQLPARPYCKGPDGDDHIKVTAIATLPQYSMVNGHHTHPNFVSVDPEYLRGSVPSLLRREPIWGVLFSLSLLLLAVGEYLNHASNTDVGSRLESVGWFAVIVSFSSYTVARAFADGASPRVNMCGWFEWLGIICRIQCDARSRDRGSKFSTLFFILATVACIVVSGFVLDMRIYVWTGYSVIAAISFLALSLHYLGRKEDVDTWYELGLASLFFFGIALLFKRYDMNGLCSDPSGYFQAHAVWHSLSACGVGLAYLTLRSDMWMYDLVTAREERRNEALGDAYRVPGLDSEITSRPPHPSSTSMNPQFDGLSRPRTLETDGSRRRTTLERDGDRTSGSFSRPRTLERDDSNGGGNRPRTLERENSEGSKTSSRRLEQLRAQARERTSRKTQRTLDSDSEMDSSIGAAYWTCPECAYEDNELGFLVCERCQAERPPLDEFVPMSVVQGYL